MSYTVTNIQVTNNETVNFSDSTGVIRNFSRIAPPTQTYILRNKTDIIIIQPVGQDLILEDGNKASDHFVFSALTVEHIGVRAYTSIDQADPDAADLNLARAKAIYNDLVTNIFKGCCDCSCDGGCSIQYEYNSDLDSGQFYYASGTLFMSMESYLNQDFSGFLHHLSDGSWVSFFSSADPTQWVVYEISNYAVISGLALWDAVLVDGSLTFEDGLVFCLTYQPALGGGGGSQSFQQTLDVDSTLDKDNTVAGAGSVFTWDNFKDWLVNATRTIRHKIINGGSYFTTEITNSQAGVEASNGSVITGFYAKAAAVLIRSFKVGGGTATAGHAFVLTNAATGEADFNHIDTGGLANNAVTYAKMQNVSATDRLLGRSTAGAGNVEEIVCTAQGRALLDDATAADQRTTMGIKRFIPIFMSPLSDTVAASTTSYYAGYFGIGTDSTTEVNRATVLGIGGDYKNLYVYINGAQPAGGSLVFTNRIATGMGAFSDGSTSVTIAAGSAAGIYSDLVNVTTYAAGDRITMKVTNGSGSASAPISSWWATLESSY